MTRTMERKWKLDTKSRRRQDETRGLNEFLWSFTLKITNLSIIVINLYYEISRTFEETLNKSVVQFERQRKVF